MNFYSNILNNYFEHVYCINLDEATERWKKCQWFFGKHGLIVERVSGIKPTESKNGLLVGELGCMLSHLSIIEDAKKNNYKNILVLEDDFEFVDKFDKIFESKIKNIPSDWDFLYLGGNHVGGISKVNDDFYKTNHTYTTMSYALNQNVYDTILTHSKKLNKPIDVYYADLQKTHNSYVIRPHICSQRSGYSYINGVNVDYDFLRR